MSDNEIDVQKIEVIDIIDEDIYPVAIIENQLDGAIVIKDGLNKIRSVVKNSLDNTGLNQTNAELLTIAIESILKPITKDVDYHNVKINNSYIPSVENFEYIRERETNTRVSLENINNHWKSFWLWVAEKIKKMVKNIKEFHERNTLFLEGLILSIERTERYIVGINSNGGDKKFNHNSISNALSVNGRVPLELKKHLDNIYTLTNSILSSTRVTEVQNIVDAVKRYSNNPTVSIRSEINAFLKAPVNLTKLTSVNKTDTVDLVSKYESMDIFGNKRIVYRALDVDEWTEEDLVKQLDNFGGRVEYIIPKLKPTIEIPVLPINDLKYLLAKSKQIALIIKAYKKNTVGIVKALDDLTNLSTANASKQNPTSQSRSVKDKLLDDLFIIIPNLARQPALTYVSYASNVISAMNQYVKQCIRLNITTGK